MAKREEEGRRKKDRRGVRGKGNLKGKKAGAEEGVKGFVDV